MTDGHAITFSLPYSASKVKYRWQDGSADSFFVVRSAGLYWVKVEDSCSVISDTVNVLTSCALPIYVPNAFTPNGDGLNDLVKIADMKGQTLERFSIYNRYGEEVFTCRDLARGWDGTWKGQNQPLGVYVYFIRYKDLRGASHTTKGTLVLIR